MLRAAGERADGLLVRVRVRCRVRVRVTVTVRGRVRVRVRVSAREQMGSCAGTRCDARSEGAAAVQASDQTVSHRD
jgi:hypothetical protein